MIYRQQANGGCLLFLLMIGGATFLMSGGLILLPFIIVFFLISGTYAHIFETNNRGVNNSTRSGRLKGKKKVIRITGEKLLDLLFLWGIGLPIAILLFNHIYL